MIKSFLPSLKANLIALALLPSASVLAASYEPSIEQSQWLNDGNIFGCRLYQPIPNFGLAVFEHRAGEEPVFLLESSRMLFAQTNGSLTIEAPSYRSSALTSALGMVSLAQPPEPVRVEPERTYRLLAELEQGMAPAVTGMALHGADTVHVRTAPNGFTDSMGQFHACQGMLLPVNFDQIERSAVYFEFNQAEYGDEAETLINNIATYVNADPAITGLFVDGHADESGTRFYNRRLSEDRASMVTNALIAAGVPAELILTRYHGERYPVSRDQALNRRVTIRLERVPNAPFEPGM
ncbi:flagellar protein MotY [Salinibius halmophilus]|uniref:flagellar protein MotY n=1 Tax=Salinibius halmophilus TaxID=1853216 RepID=UPI000E66D6C3|nr:OmpA family protein [Salinibius halmophilus]